MGGHPEESRLDLQEASPRGVAKDALDSSNELRQHVRNVVHQRHSVATQHPGLLLGLVT